MNNRIEVYGPDGALIISEPVIEHDDTHRVRVVKPDEIAVKRVMLAEWYTALIKAKRTISELTLKTRQFGWGGFVDRLSNAADQIEAVLKGDSGDAQGDSVEHQ